MAYNDEYDEDSTYEYPDPELVQQSTHQAWPTNNVDDEGNPDDPELRALTATIRTQWPNGEEPEEEDDGDYDFTAINPGLSTLAGDGFDMEYQDDDQTDDKDSTSDSSEEVEAPPPVRGRTRGRPRGRGRGGHKRPAENNEDHPRNRKRKKAKGRLKGGKRGIRKTLPPSAMFSQLQGEATQLFITGNYEKAEVLANQAVVENPEQFSAHSLLSEIFFERGDLERSIASLFAGAHVRMRDPDVWERSAELIVQRSGDLRLPKMLEDALYCYSRVLTLESDRVDMRVARAGLYHELGQPRKALRDLQYVLKQTPKNVSILRMLIEIAVELEDIKEAITNYDKLIKILQETETEEAVSFVWSDLHLYGELLISANKPAESIVKLKRVARWILGRGSDKYWEYQTTNDSEFDVHDEPRRIQVVHMAQTMHDRSRYGEGIPLEIRVQFGIIRLQLDNTKEAMRHFDYLRPDSSDSSMAEDFSDLYRMIGEALREKKLFTDALIFLEPLKSLENPGDSIFYAHLAYCYRQLGRLDDAEACYRTLIEHNESDIKSRREMVEMFHAAEMEHRAAPYERELRQGKKRKYRPMFNSQGKDDRIAFVEDSPTPIPRRLILIAPAPAPQSAMVAEVHPMCDENMTSPAVEGVPIPSVEPMEQQEPLLKRHRRQHHRKKAAESHNQEDLQMAFLHMADLKGQLEEGDKEIRQEWMTSARVLLRTFREARVFFPYDRNVKFYGYTPAARAKSIRSKVKQNEIDIELAEMLNVPVDQLPKDNIPTDFCSVPFDDWLDVYLEYAIMLAEDGKRQESYSVLDIAGACNVFYCNKSYMYLITLAGGVCALLVEDDEKVSTVARYFMTTYQFTTDTYRLYSAFFRICPRPNLGWFNSGVLQKFIMRQLKAVDFCLARPNDRARPMFDERSGFFNKDLEGDPVLPTRFDIPLLFLYGQILYAAGSYTYALNYFYRARSLDPSHPLINLSLGLAYIHHAIKRQSMNRHQMIMQGLVFIYQYYDKRMESDLLAERQEALYNVGRTFHLLGLIHLAIPRYEKVLQISEELRVLRQQDRVLSEEEIKHQEDFGIDAAFALQGLYAFAGNMARAKAVVDKWMVL